MPSPLGRHIARWATSGPALYTDDLAADLRGELRDLIGNGLTGDAALRKLESEYASSLRDPDEEPVS